MLAFEVGCSASDLSPKLVRNLWIPTFFLAMFLTLVLLV